MAYVISSRIRAIFSRIVVALASTSVIVGFSANNLVVNADVGARLVTLAATGDLSLVFTGCRAAVGTKAGTETAPLGEAEFGTLGLVSGAGVAHEQTRRGRRAFRAH